MNEFINSESNFYTRPVDGYTYIYIYSLDNLYLYVGQTIQSIEGRYKNHLSDNSGAHYANNIAYFQIKSEYANYAEGYIARRVNGICQGNVPNPDNYKDDVPEDVRRTLYSIGNKLVYRKDRDEILETGDLPLFSLIIDNDGSQKETLKFLSMLLEENDTMLNHYYNKNGYYICGNELYMEKAYFSYDGIDDSIESYLLSRPKSDYRPLLFMKTDTIAKIQYIKDVISNFPVYCVVEGQLYDKYKKHIKNLFKSNQVGLMVQYDDEIKTIYKFHPNYRAIYKVKSNSLKDYPICINSDFIQFCTTTNYKARLTPYHYYQCA